MSETQSRYPGSHFVEGIQIPAPFQEENFRSALNYKAQDDDVFVVTYPKCGTTWAQYMVVHIFTKGEPLSAEKIFAVSPFIDGIGSKLAEMKPQPGAVKTHLPFRAIPWSEKAKYIYVARNPKDCCVSYYHHNKNIRSNAFLGNFDDFFEFFITGDIDYGDYFDHVLEWYEHRNDPNVLFMTYEEMKEDPEAAILKMASFIDEELYAQPLRNDPEKLGNVLKCSSFEYMKELVNRSMENLFNKPKEDILNSDLPDEIKKPFADAAAPRKDFKERAKPNPVTFVRKGIIGDWRNYFSEEQSRRMDEKFAERTKGTDLSNYWKTYM